MLRRQTEKNLPKTDTGRCRDIRRQFGENGAELEGGRPVKKQRTSSQHERGVDMRPWEVNKKADKKH